MAFKRDKAADLVAAFNGRYEPSPLEIQNRIKFNRWDHTFIERRRQEYPQLDKGNPGVGAYGRGAMSWVGCNADPSKAKFLAKQAAAREMADPLKAKFMAKQGLASAGSRSLPNMSASQLGKFRDRNLSRYTASLHYLEQKKGMGPLQVQGAKSQKVPVEELLYSGISRDLEGRQAYLQSRHQMAPQDKNAAPVSSAQEVGWQCYQGPDKVIGRQLKPCRPPPSMIYFA